MLPCLSAVPAYTRRVASSPFVLEVTLPFRPTRRCFLRGGFRFSFSLRSVLPFAPVRLLFFGADRRYSVYRLRRASGKPSFSFDSYLRTPFSSFHRLKTVSLSLEAHLGRSSLE